LIFFPLAALHFSSAWSHRDDYAPGALEKCALLEKKISAHWLPRLTQVSAFSFAWEDKSRSRSPNPIFVPFGSDRAKAVA